MYHLDVRAIERTIARGTSRGRLQWIVYIRMSQCVQNPTCNNHLNIQDALTIQKPCKPQSPTIHEQFLLQR